MHVLLKATDVAKTSWALRRSGASREAGGSTKRFAGFGLDLPGRYRTRLRLHILLRPISGKPDARRPLRRQGSGLRSLSPPQEA